MVFSFLKTDKNKEKREKLLNQFMDVNEVKNIKNC